MPSDPSKNDVQLSLERFGGIYKYERHSIVPEGTEKGFERSIFPILGRDWDFTVTRHRVNR